MKKISMIELSRRAMGAREMNALTGGNVCGCGCHGSSSTQANANANYKGSKSWVSPKTQLQAYTFKRIIS